MTTNAILLEHLGCGRSDKVGVDLVLGRPWEPVQTYVNDEKERNLIDLIS